MMIAAISNLLNDVKDVAEETKSINHFDSHRKLTIVHSLIYTSFTFTVLK